MNQIQILVKDFCIIRDVIFEIKSEDSLLDLINFIYTFSTGEQTTLKDSGWSEKL